MRARDRAGCWFKKPWHRGELCHVNRIDSEISANYRWLLKMLWGRAAGRCSHPDCRMDVFFEEREADTPTLVGENCHIIAENDGGSRSDYSVPLDQNNSYSNLILMCRRGIPLGRGPCRSRPWSEILRRAGASRECWFRSWRLSRWRWCAGTVLHTPVFAATSGSPELRPCGPKCSSWQPDHRGQHRWPGCRRLRTPAFMARAPTERASC